MNRILIINPFGIGDVLFSTPLITSLRKNFPSSFIAFICNKRTRDLLETNPELNEVFVFEKDEYKNLWKRSRRQCIIRFLSFLNLIRKKRFNLVVDLSSGHQYGFFLKLVGVKQRIGFNYKGRGRFQTKRLEFAGFDNKPIADYYLDLLKLLGLEVRSEETSLYLRPADERFAEDFFNASGLKRENRIIGIAPGGGVSFGKEKIRFKRWDAQKFALLIDEISSNLKSKVVILWGPGERGLTDKILAISKSRPLISPPSTIRQMAAIMKRCNIIVANDAGPLHVAASQRVRTVSIFGPSDEKVYGAYPPGGRNIIVAKQLNCRPCYLKFKIPDCETRRCLNEITPQEVLGAIGRLLEK